MNESFSNRSPIMNPENIIEQPHEQSVEQKDSRYFSIGNVPSEYKPYNFDEILIRPFAFRELKLISRAAQTKTISNVIRAVDSCLDVDAFNLTVGDFYYILFWLRLNSYPKTPWTVQWTCRNLVKKNNQEDVCGHRNLVRLSSSSIEVIPLEADSLEEGLDYPRAKHLDDIQSMMDDPDYKFLIKEVQWIAGDTLQDKIEALENSEDLSLYEAAKEASDNYQHGIVETLNLRCEECGGLYSHKMAINPLTFFR